MPDPLPLRDILIPANVGRRFVVGGEDGDVYDIVRLADGSVSWCCSSIDDEDSGLMDRPVTLLDDAPAQGAVRVEATVAITPEGNYCFFGDGDHDERWRLLSAARWAGEEEFSTVTIHADIHPPRVETTPARVERVEVEG